MPDNVQLEHKSGNGATTNASAAPKTNKPTRTPRPKVWTGVPDEQWDDWRWQLKHRLNSVEELEQIVRLSESEKKALRAKNLFRVDITPYFACLIDPDDPDCPIRRQVIPTDAEMVPFTSMMEDSLAEDRHSPVPGLVHRYPDRVLMLVTTQCASYCRYCTRSRIVGDPAAQFSRTEYDAQIESIARTPQIRDVLLSRVEPFNQTPKVMDNLLARLRAIPHLDIIRLGTRSHLPAAAVDHELCETLAKYHPCG
jgi:lysine 2,3-aminomutase